MTTKASNEIWIWPYLFVVLFLTITITDICKNSKPCIYSTKIEYGEIDSSLQKYKYIIIYNKNAFQ